MDRTVGEILENKIAAICVDLKDGTIVWENESSCQFLGVCLGIGGNFVTQFNAFIDSAVNTNGIASDVSLLLSSESSLELRYSVGGDRRWAVAESYVCSEGYRLITYRDITPYREVILQLQKTNTLFSIFYDRSPLACVEWSKDFRVVRINDKAEEMFGWDAEFIEGKHPSELKWIHEEDLEKVTKVIRELQTGRVTSNSSHNRNYTKTGMVISCQWTNFGVTENGVQKFYSIILDITKEIEMERKFKEMSNRQEVLMQLLPNRSRSLSTSIMNKLIDHPLSGTTRAQVEAEVLLRSMEEAVKKMSHTLYHNGSSVITRLALCEERAVDVEADMVRIERDMDNLETKCQELLEKLNRVENSNFFSLVKTVKWQSLVMWGAGLLLVAELLNVVIYPNVIEPVLQNPKVQEKIRIMR